jgi:hypothetical protein
MYPTAWEIHNEFRSSRTAEADWPEYVFAPRQAARWIVNRDRPASEKAGPHIALVGTLAAWRPTQGIYRFDDSLLDALWATSVTGALPGQLLHRLPEWCVYIELGKHTFAGLAHGVWARIGFDTDTRQEELDLLVDLNDDAAVVRVPLIGNLEDSLRVSHRNTRKLAGGDPKRLFEADVRHEQRRAFAEPILSVVLYLCSANVEMTSDAQAGRPKRPSPRRRKSGELRWPAADEPTIWETGTRLGAALRAAQKRFDDSSGEGSDANTRPHIRRAHWHTYWVGAVSSPERRQEVRWLPPIAVNLDPHEAPPEATIRPVPGRK